MRFSILLAVGLAFFLALCGSPVLGKMAASSSHHHRSTTPASLRSAGADGFANGRGHPPPPERSNSTLA